MTQPPKKGNALELAIHPLTPERWDDLATLFGEKGAQGGCWCMWWRSKPKVYKQQAGEGNKTALHTLVDEGHVTGLLAFHDAAPIGWCSVAPRPEFARMPTSLAWKPVDDQPVWSIVCYFVHRDYRGQAVATRLLRAAVEYAAAQGAKIVEAYPKDIGATQAANRDLYFGTLKMYVEAGFVEVVRRLPAFPIVRFYIP